MKTKIYITVILFTISFSDLLACNVCGCGVGNYHYGILPQFQKNFVGLRYRYRSYLSHLEDGHMAHHSSETFQSAELWGRFYPVERLQAFVFIPYNINERQEGSKMTYLRGIGDVVVSANYNIINTYDSTASNWKHNLLAGAGVKLPTGAFRKLEDGLTINQNFQLGTGSVDLLLNLIYTVRYKRMGINTEFTYNVNGTNRDEYHFGNTSRTGLSAFYILNAGSVTVMPNAGVSIETYEDNSQFGEPFSDTGGWAILYQAGIESYYRNFAFGLSYQDPGRQELFSGKVISKSRFAAHLTVMF